MSQNHFLAALSRETQEILDPNLELIEVRKGQPEAGNNSREEAIYFPLTGLFSLELRLYDGFCAHLALLGFRNVIGTGHFSDSVLPGFARAVVSGYSLRMPKDKFVEISLEQVDLQSALQEQLIHNTALIGIGSACNMHHALSKRLARWLTVAAEVSAAKSFELTHEELAHLLGVRREAITEAVARLAQTGAIETARGRISLRDPLRLQGFACECHRTWTSSRSLIRPTSVAVKSPSVHRRIAESVVASGM